MSESVLILAAFVGGLGLGAVFFGGLWWTVTRALNAAVPGIWFGLSALLRMTIAVGGLYGCARLGLPCLVACLGGLLVARGAVKHLTGAAC
jgi:F1F0 ATPase subunit 2